MNASLTLPLRIACFASAMLAMSPALALFKVIGPDGKVTYTDRAPDTPGTKVGTVAADGGDAAADASLPYGLRQVASRYPVTLYSASGCQACDSGRRWLRDRGIPFNEKLLANNDDNAEMRRRFGGTEIPTLTIGAQPSKGFSADEWGSLLDAAGYPRSSQLPSTYRAPPATPLAERKPANEPETSSAAPAPPTAPPPIEPAATPSNPTGIRF